MGKSRARIPHADVYQRINYLYQAAHESVKNSPNDVQLCRFYIYTLRNITRRNCLHLHPDMKRNMCKRCCVLLIPGVTSIVRTRRKRQRHTVVTCLECGTPRRYVYKPAKTPWVDKSEAWEDKIVFGKPVPKDNQQQNQKKRKSSKESVSNVSSDVLEKDKTTLETESEKRKIERDHQDRVSGEKIVKDSFESESKRRKTDEINVEIPSTSKDRQSDKSIDKNSENHRTGLTTKVCSSQNEKRTSQMDCHGATGKASVQSSPNPNEKVEVTEERPDEYLYKMTFIPSYYPYLG